MRPLKISGTKKLHQGENVNHMKELIHPRGVRIYQGGGRLDVRGRGVDGGSGRF